MKQQVLFWRDSILNSYSQIFFSTNPVFGLILISITFLDPYLGFSGFISVLFSNALAVWFGFDRSLIRRGDYSFNSLLVGLGLGAYYDPNLPFLILILNAAFITFLLTLLFGGVLYKYALPYLSLPFLFALWIILLAAQNFEALGISERGVFVLNELYTKGSGWLVNVYHWFNSLAIHESIKIYIKSLGAIFFQFNIVSGLLIAFGLLLYSRIAFSISIISFYTAFLFYQFIGAEISELSYSYIGFNFILSGIAIGAFFLIPSKWSYLWAVLLVPSMVIITAALGGLFAYLQIGIFSLPFNLVVLSFLYALRVRPNHSEPKLTSYQLFSPEKNLYEYICNHKRFRSHQKPGVGLPVVGGWTVSQGYDGPYTHKGEWKEALDLVVTDVNSSQFKGEGNRVEDYYCYGKPVLAPAAGTVVSLIDGIEDNTIGQVDLINNWGNTVVIKHGEYLYSQVSHLKKDSIKIAEGDLVGRGQIIAQCGNSGRSPYPHLHFQLQASPTVGSPTISYPLDHYLQRNQGANEYRSFDIPSEKTIVSSVPVDEELVEAFNFQPGQVLKCTTDTGTILKWEVGVDQYNQSYLKCLSSGATAGFINDGTSLCFTSFEGSKGTVLYEFYLALYKVLFHFDQKLKLTEQIPLYLVDRSLTRKIMDILAPFWVFRKAVYSSNYQRLTTDDESILLNAVVNLEGGGPVRKRAYRTTIEDGKLISVKTKKGDVWEEVVHID